MAWFSHCFQNLDIPRLAPLQQKGRLIILTGKSKHYKLENDHKPDKYKGNVLVPSGGGGGGGGAHIIIRKSKTTPLILTLL